MAKAEPTASDSTIAQSRPYIAMIEQVRSQAELNASLGGNQSRAFELASLAIDRIAEANTWDEIFEANNAGVLPGVEEAATKGPLTLQEVEFSPSQEQYRQGGVGVYAYVDSVTDNGEEFQFTTGSVNVVMSLFHAQKKGILKDARIRIEQRGRMYLVTAP